jgi:hypothetical protein
MSAGKAVDRYNTDMLLFCVSFILLWNFKLSFIQMFDSFGYVRDVVFGQKSNLALGRIGYMLIYSPVWIALKALTGLSPLQVHHVIKTGNVFFGSLTIIMVYHIASRLFGNKNIGLGSALLLLFSRDYIALTGSVHPTAAMMFFLTLGILAYIKAFEEKNGRMLLASALAYGFSIAVYETAVFMLPFFIIYPLVKSRVFDVKILLQSALIVLVVVSAGPVLLQLTGKADYVSDLPRWFSWGSGDIIVGSYTPEGFLKRWDALLFQVWPGFGTLGFPIAGIALMSIRKDWRRLAVVLSLFTPAFFFFIMGTIWPRYFTYTYISLAIFTAYFVYESAVFASRHLPKIRVTWSHTILLIYVLGLFLHNDVWYLGMRDRVSIENERYGLRLMHDLPEDAVFILGEDYPVLGEYFIPLTGSRKTAIPSGWDWPGDRLDVVVGNHLAAGRTVIVDLDSIKGGELDDVEKLRDEYRFTQIDGGLYSIGR